MPPYPVDSYRNGSLWSSCAFIPVFVKKNCKNRSFNLFYSQKPLLIFRIYFWKLTSSIVNTINSNYGNFLKQQRNGSSGKIIVISMFKTWQRWRSHWLIYWIETSIPECHGMISLVQCMEMLLGTLGDILLNVGTSQRCWLIDVFIQWFI